MMSPPSTDPHSCADLTISSMDDGDGLYVAPPERADTRELARATFAADRDRHHPIAVTVAETRLRAFER